MNIIIHPNRWLIWTIALIVMIFIIVWGAIQRYAIEQETEITGQNSLLGRETSKLDTTGWKTYRNERYGFEFKYPEDISLKTDTSGYIIISERNVVDAKELTISSLRRKDSTRTLAEFVHNYNGYDEEDIHTQFGNENKEFINGIEVYTFEEYYGSRSEAHYFFLKNKNEGVDALYVLYANENPMDIPFKKFQQILSSLKFFEPKR
ncbi:MAG: hypothetical protein A3F26_02165 [Candidatus Ryanbacteria bacterium RIFCSPHIGHO2_12_FULL_47_12b]|nr:MAG: hypothetical protein A3F26_02165 [Candidatus Ryanbacteria bacterium RIFCSPHIGHO2_12_FULL_47_12b]